jgi:tetratricopeptide (TPR) repeat protein
MPFLDRTAEAHWRMALLLERRGDEARAEAELRRALTLDADYAPAHMELARGALAERHYGEALRHLDRLIQRRPNDAEALEALSLTHRSLGHLDQAQQYARKAVRLAPRSADAWRALGEVLKDRATPTDLARAEPAFRQAVQLDPTSSDLHDQLGQIAFSRGDYAGAATELQRAIDLQPLNRLPYPALMQCCRRLGQNTRADRLAAEYRKIDAMDLATAPLEYSIWAMPQNTALRLRLARLYRQYGRPDLALGQVERVLELNPGQPEARRLREELKPGSPAVNDRTVRGKGS